MHAYRVQSFADSFTMTEVWRTDANSTITHPDSVIPSQLTPRFRSLAAGEDGGEMMLEG